MLHRRGAEGAEERREIHINALLFSAQLCALSASAVNELI